MSIHVPDETRARAALLIENRRRYTQHPLGGRAKRCIDFVVALVALVVLSPLFLMLAALVKLYDGGPVVYRHPRIGYNGCSFPCFKFRTMVINADEVLQRHISSSETTAREWGETRKLKSDPRITPVGAVLRQLSLDELPQLINIIRGEMSIVGPRPIVSDEIRMYGPHVNLYFSARPGLTGAWQVSGRNDVSYDRRVAIDRDYVENWSLSADLHIIVRTIPAVIMAKGTY